MCSWQATCSPSEAGRLMLSRASHHSTRPALILVGYKSTGSDLYGGVERAASPEGPVHSTQNSLLGSCKKCQVERVDGGIAGDAMLWHTAVVHQALQGAVLRCLWVARPCSNPLAGTAEWARERTGDAARDLPLLHSVSCNDPEAFWGAVLRCLRIRFAQPPARSAI